jgi:hypothetical protein
VHVTKERGTKNSEMRAEMKPDPDSLGAQLRASINVQIRKCAQALNIDDGSQMIVTDHKKIPARLYKEPFY